MTWSIGLGLVTLIVCTFSTEEETSQRRRSLGLFGTQIPHHPVEAGTEKLYGQSLAPSQTRNESLQLLLGMWKASLLSPFTDNYN